jgi:hypothetical protein
MTSGSSGAPAEGVSKESSAEANGGASQHQN